MSKFMRWGVCFLLFTGLLLPSTVQAQVRDIDFDWIASTLDTLLKGFAPGININLVNMDNDGNGIQEDDALALLAAVLRGGTRVPTTCMSAAQVAAIQADFEYNRGQVADDMRIAGVWTNFLFATPADDLVRAMYGHDRLPEILKGALAPYGGAMVGDLLVDYMAGLATISDNPATFTHINNYLGQIVDALASTMNNENLYITDMWTVLRAERSVAGLYLDATRYRRWGASPSTGKVNLFGSAGNFGGSATTTGASYTAAGYVSQTPRLPNTWRETFMTNEGIVQPPLRITVPPLGTPQDNHVNNGDMISVATWTLGTGWSQSAQGAAAPQTLFYVLQKTAGNVNEAVQTNANQPTGFKITDGVTYRVEFSYKWTNDDDPTQSANSISVALGTAVSGAYTSTNLDWHNEVVYLTAAGANPSFRIIPTTNFAGMVDNVKVKVAKLAGDTLDTGTVTTVGGVAPYVKSWEDAKDFPSTGGGTVLNNWEMKNPGSYWTANAPWAYVNKRGPGGLVGDQFPQERFEKTAAGTGALVQTEANMKRPLITGQWYIVSYSLYLTAGAITPYLGGTALTTRSTVMSGNYCTVYTQIIQCGAGAHELSFVPTDAFRGAIAYADVRLYNYYELDPHWTGDPPGSRTPDLVADGNGYQGTGTDNLVFDYLLTAHNNIAPVRRVSDTGNGSYTSQTVYNVPDRPETIPAGTIEKDGRGGRSSRLTMIEVGPRAFQILPQPPALTGVAVGGTLTLTSGAVGGDSVPTYKWQKNISGTWTDIAGATGKTYTKAGYVVGDAGDYRLVATNTDGGGTTIYSNTAVVQTTVPLAVTNPSPATINAAVGGSASFSVTASGGAGGYTYQWQKNTGAWVNISGATAATLPLSPLVAGDQAQYRCVVTDSALATATSGAATLTVLAIQTQPVSLTRTTGTAANFSVTVLAGSGTGGYTYQWKKDGVNIGGATGATHNIAACTMLDAASAPGYVCEVRDSSGALLNSSAATLTVNAAGITVTGPTPTTPSIYLTQNYTFTVSATGGSGAGFTLTYQWQKDGVDIPGANSASYTVNNATAASAGVYQCFVGETPNVRPPAAKVASATATLTVNAAPITINPQPAGGTRYVTQSFAFTTGATAPAGTISYQWQKNISGTWTNLGSATAATLNFASVTLADAGDYRCVITCSANPTPSITGQATLTVTSIPITVTGSPSNVSKYVTETAQFTASATVPAGAVTYQWQRWNGTAWANVTGGSGATTATYTTAVLGLADNGAQFRCLFGDTLDPTASAPSGTATLTVTAIPVNFTTQPAGASKYVSESHTFTVVASSPLGSTFTYQWQKNISGTWTDIGGATSASYPLTNLTTANSGDYRCVVKNSLNPVATAGTPSNTATLTVTNIPINITVQPSNTSVYVTQTAQFSVTATSPTGTVTHQWQRWNGTAWANVTGGSGATTATYTTAVLGLADTGARFRCVLGNTADAGASNTSGEGVLTVTVIPVNFTTQPSGASKYVSESHTFTVVASSPLGSAFTYQWQKNISGTWTDIGGATSASYPLTNLTTANSGDYRCVVKNSLNPMATAGTPSNAATLTVTNIPINITAQPVDASVYVTQTAQFSVTATSPTGTVTYQWQRWNGTAWANVSTGTGSTTATWTTAALTLAENGAQFRCLLGNTADAGAVNNTVTAALTVSVIPVTITAHPAGANKSVSESHSFSVTATSPLGSTFTYQWQKWNGTAWADIGGATANPYALTNLQTTDSGDYRCVVKNSLNPVATAGTPSNAATLTVTLAAINITAQPAGGQKYVGDSHTLSVTATGGVGTLGYQWESSADGVGGWTAIAGATSPTRTMNPLALTDDKYYRCRIGDGARPPQPYVYSDVVQLQVRAVLNITGQPAGANTIAGASHTFTVTVTGGYTPLNYQWKRGATNVGTNSNTLALSGLAYADQGSYTCVITDARGATVTTAARTLTVLEIQTQPVGGDKLPGQSHTFSVTVRAGSGTGGYTYQWKKDGANIAQTGASFTLSSLVLGDAGSYVCEVRDSSGALLPSAAAVLNITANPINFTAQPAGGSKYVTQSHSFSVTCTGGTGTLTYKWQKDGVDIPGATGNIYTIGSLATTDTGSYQCLVGDTTRPPAPYATSNAVTLTVSLAPVNITVDPVGGSKLVSQSHTFSVTANTPAGGLTYQWQKDGVDIPTATGSTYSIATLATTDTGSYRCLVKSTANPVATPATPSAAAALTVTNIPITVTGSPSNASKYVTETAQFTAAATTTPGGITYQWQRWNGTAWANVTGGSGATTATYTTAVLGLADTGARFRCVLGNTADAGASNTSGEGVLTVTVIPVNFTTQPSGASKYVSESHTFTVVAGSPLGSTFTYQWQKNISGTWTDIGGATSASYPLTNLTTANSGDYRCVVKNSLNPVATAGTPSNAATLTVSNIPITVDTQPSNASVYVTQTAQFTVAASSPVGTVTHQWQRWNGTAWANVTGGSGATTATYTTAATAITDNGARFRCVLGNTADAGAANTSGEGVLTVTVIPVNFTAQPAGASKYVSESHSFSVTASSPLGSAFTYQWQKNISGTWTDIGGATSASYPLTNLTTANSGDYRCVVKNSLNPVATAGTPSNAATLGVTNIPINITAEPVNASVYVTQTAQFSVTATSPAGTVTHQWQRWDGTAWANVTGGSGATTATYTTAVLALADSGAQFRCLLGNNADAGAAKTSATATLTVSVIPVNITAQPSGASKSVSESHSLSVTATSPLGGSFTYQWQKDISGTWTDIGGATANPYALTNLQIADSGDYRCVVKNSLNPVATAGTPSNAATLTVSLADITITTQPLGAQKLTGGAHTMTVAATGGTGPLTYQWQKDGADISGQNTDTLALTGLQLSDGGTYTCLVGDNARPSSAPRVASSGAVLEVRVPVSITTHPAGANKKTGDSHTFSVGLSGGYTPYTFQWYRDAAPVGGNSDTLVIGSLTAADQGVYTCQVTGGMGTVTTSNPATLTVLAIQNQPAAQGVSVGDSASFGVTVLAGSGVPGYTYQWRYKGADIPGAVGAVLPLNNVQGGSPDGNPAPVNPTGNEGAYSCVVTDVAGVSLTSSPATLTVASVALDFTTQPVGGRVHAGGSRLLSVSLSGGYGPVYTYQWQKDGVDISGANGPTLALSPVALGDAGTYTCLAGETGVRPPLSLVTSAGALIETADPVSITGQPSGADLYAGETFTATVSAAGGFGALSFQWRKDGADISGQTGATLTLGSVQASDAAGYTCAVTDEEGSTAVSNAAALTVSPHITFTTHPAGALLLPGAPYTMTAAATGGKGALQYRWYRGGSVVGTGATYTITSATLTDAGAYACEVTDSGLPVPETAMSNSAVVTLDVVFAFDLQPQTGRAYYRGENTFSCSVIFNTGDVAYTWYGPGGVVIPQSPFDQPNTRRLVDLQYAQTGEYYVTATDDKGTPGDASDDETITSNKVMLYVGDHLAITTQPQGGTIPEGGSHTMTVATSGGFAPLVYEWHKEGSPDVLGTGASLTISGADATDEGVYYVTIVDMKGEIKESAHVTLAVITGMPAAGSLGLLLGAAALALAGARGLRRRR